MANTSGVSAIIQNQFMKYLRRNFGRDFDGEVDKICRIGLKLNILWSHQLTKECMKSLKTSWTVP
jgi:hypothetical protein